MKLNFIIFINWFHTQVCYPDHNYVKSQLKGKQALGREHRFLSKFNTRGSN
jgi:hypothetical protein